MSKKIRHLPGIAFKVGARVEAQDCLQKWYPSRIEKIDYNEGKMLVHFDRWSHRYDEWIHWDSNRLRPLKRPILRKRGLKDEEETAVDFKSGEEVLARWTDCRYYPAKVETLNKEGTYTVQFYDGVIRCVKKMHIKSMPEDAKGQDWIALVKAAAAATTKNKIQCKPRSSTYSSKDKEEKKGLKVTPKKEAEESTSEAPSPKVQTSEEKSVSPESLVKADILKAEPKSASVVMETAASKKKNSQCSSFQAKRARLNKITGFLASKAVVADSSEKKKGESKVFPLNEQKLPKTECQKQSVNLLSSPQCERTNSAITFSSGRSRSRKSKAEPYNSFGSKLKPKSFTTIAFSQEDEIKLEPQIPLSETASSGQSQGEKHHRMLKPNHRHRRYQRSLAVLFEPPLEQVLTSTSSPTGKRLSSNSHTKQEPGFLEVETAATSLSSQKCDMVLPLDLSKHSKVVMAASPVTPVSKQEVEGQNETKIVHPPSSLTERKTVVSSAAGAVIRVAPTTVKPNRPREPVINTKKTEDFTFTKETVIDLDHNKFKCKVPGCLKAFRKAKLLDYHLKYYHSTNKETELETGSAGSAVQSHATSITVPTSTPETQDSKRLRTVSGSSSLSSDSHTIQVEIPLTSNLKLFKSSKKKRSSTSLSSDGNDAELSVFVKQTSFESLHEKILKKVTEKNRDMETCVLKSEKKIKLEEKCPSSGKKVAVFNVLIQATVECCQFPTLASLASADLFFTSLCMETADNNEIIELDHTPPSEHTALKTKVDTFVNNFTKKTLLSAVPEDVRGEDHTVDVILFESFTQLRKGIIQIEATQETVNNTVQDRENGVLFSSVSLPLAANQSVVSRVSEALVYVVAYTQDVAVKEPVARRKTVQVVAQVHKFIMQLKEQQNLNSTEKQGMVHSANSDFLENRRVQPLNFLLPIREQNLPALKQSRGRSRSRNKRKHYGLNESPYNIKKTFFQPKKDLMWSLSSHVLSQDEFNLLQRRILSYPLGQKSYNLTKAEHEALLNLQENDTIVIRPADKGGPIVIMDKNKYDFTVSHMLKEDVIYEKLPPVRVKLFIEKVLKQLKDMLLNGKKKEKDKERKEKKDEAHFKVKQKKKKKKKKKSKQHDYLKYDENSLDFLDKCSHPQSLGNSVVHRNIFQMKNSSCQYPRAILSVDLTGENLSDVEFLDDSSTESLLLSGDEYNQDFDSANLEDSQGEENTTHEIVRCVCDMDEENGFMIQCEECLCWQHSTCMGLLEETIPERYVCYICRDPTGQRWSAKYRFDKDWLNKGHLYGLSFLNENYSHQNAKKIIATHHLLADVYSAAEILHSLKLKIGILQSKQHSDLHFWACSGLQTEEASVRLGIGKGLLTFQEKVNCPEYNDSYKVQFNPVLKAENNYITSEHSYQKPHVYTQDHRPFIDPASSDDEDDSSSLDDEHGIYFHASKRQQELHSVKQRHLTEQDAAKGLPLTSDNNYERIQVEKQGDSYLQWQLNLLTHIENVQNEVTTRIELIEKEVDVLESWLDFTGELEPPEPLARLPQLKRRIKQLLADLGKVQQMATLCPV
ncbi:PHD finger protein 20-like protein 1 [Protopterus annectens]|uniref:PHD finger protein 20-like protein 1 n=1 Tax=Protopterus annectens TaxID=7888 RepID=UPI001CFAB6C8|nr:PHD finger protein 20-like protein 1 [Protopterus annectens]